MTMRTAKEEWNDLDDDMPANNNRVAFDVKLILTMSNCNRPMQNEENGGKLQIMNNKVWDC